eukprot:scaffold26569_cov107-Isochrysis_galbana.AAC.10
MAGPAPLLVTSWRCSPPPGSATGNCRSRWRCNRRQRCRPALHTTCSGGGARGRWRSRKEQATSSPCATRTCPPTPPSAWRACAASACNAPVASRTSRASCACMPWWGLAWPGWAGTGSSSSSAPSRGSPWPRGGKPSCPPPMSKMEAMAAASHGTRSCKYMRVSRTCLESPATSHICAPVHMCEACTGPGQGRTGWKRRSKRACGV